MYDLLQNIVFSFIRNYFTTTTKHTATDFCTEQMSQQIISERFSYLIKTQNNLSSA